MPRGIILEIRTWRNQREARIKGTIALFLATETASDRA